MSFTTASSPSRSDFKENKLLWVFIAGFFVVLAVTLILTTDINNWMLENILTICFLAFLWLFYPKFKFSDLSYTFIVVYLTMHVYGSMYTYAENPFGYWLMETLDWERNQYDRMVHFSFGFMLAYPMRDIFVNWFDWPKWVCWALPCEITLSFSGMYELIEWSVAALFFPEQGTAYLGTQGDAWDAQKDMGLAFLSSVLIMALMVAGKKIFDRR